ncbi:probable cation-transporting ATPase 13A5 [Pyxicephalus adspersus]|uniref:probable cation-transporting ATPase 13A5 n=1 Tax=Pyxicephalus adspersus TaxID=30357 RepID=UPI003B5930AD
MKTKESNDHSAIINEGEDNEMEIFGYRLSIPWIILCVIGYCLSGGTLLLIFYWKPEWSVWANCVKSSLEKANVVLLRTTDEQKKYTRKKVRWITLKEFKELENSKCSVISDENSVLNKAIKRPEIKVKYIRVQKIRFVWNYVQKRFENIGTLEENLSCYNMHSYYGSGLKKEEQAIRLVCGYNTIEVEVAPLWKLFIFKVLDMIYIYQFFAIILMLVEGYLGYAVAILVLCSLNIIFALVELRKLSTKLHNLVKAHNNLKCTVYQRNGGIQVESRYLVPGDIVVLTGKNFFMSCDAVLINGTCVVNEGMLTGESIPVTKTQLPHLDKTMPWKQYSGEDYKRHVLFCGTEVIRTESTTQGPAKAVVLRTGFNTTKGDMVRSILYPKPLNFKLQRDVRWFYGFLLCLAIIGIIYAVTIYVQRKVPARRIIVESLVLVICAVSPVIPAALMVGIRYAKRRLTKKRIYCVSPDRINMCGQINLFCFDKTGTLTEDGLDLMGVIPSKGACFQEMVTHEQTNKLSEGPLFAAMTCCHSIILVDGKLQGDPLDMKMFEATEWVIEDNCEDFVDQNTPQKKIVRPGPGLHHALEEGIEILFQYPFSSAMMRMSVITTIKGRGEMDVYMKGAPETVASFCKAETASSSYLATALGTSLYCDAWTVVGRGSTSSRSAVVPEEVECDMEFLGLLILENRLKPETQPVLEELNTANIRTVMITGDNIQTATTVAKKCGMISDGSKVILVEARKPEGSSPASVTWKLLEYPTDKINANDISLDIENILDEKIHNNDYHFSLSGKTYENLEKYFYDLLPKILMNGTVYARMSPGQKSTIIDEFRKLK